MNFRFVSFWEDAGRAVLGAAMFLLPVAFYLEAFDPALVKDLTLTTAAVLAAAFWLARQIETGRVEFSVPRAAFAALTATALVWAVFSYAAGSPERASCLSAARSVSFLLLFGAVLLGPASTSFADLLSGGLAAAGAFAVFASLSSTLGAEHKAEWAVLAAAAVPVSLARWADPEASTAKRAGAAVCALASLWAAVAYGRPDALAALAAGGFALAMTAVSIVKESRLRTAGMAAFAAAPAALWAALSRPAYADEALLAWAARGAEARAAVETVWGTRPWSGTGLGTVVSAPAGEPFTTAAETGAFGLALWTVVAAAALWLSWREIKRRAGHGEYRVAAVLSGQRSAFAALLAAGLLGGATRSAAGGAAFWLLAASLVALSTERGSSHVYVVPIPAPAALRRALLLPVGAAVALFLSWNAEQWNADQQLNRGVFEFNRGSGAAALEHFAGVRDGFREAPQARFLAAEVYRAAGEDETAIAMYRRALELEPDHPLAGAREGVVLAKIGRYLEAEAALRSHIAKRPESAEAYEALIDVEQNLGRGDRAREAALQLVRIDPEQPRYWRLLGEQYHSLRRFTTARKLFDKATKVGELVKADSVRTRG
jgi:tetratricopeptide (TPR) repeat protein